MADSMMRAITSSGLRLCGLRDRGAATLSVAVFALALAMFVVFTGIVPSNCKLAISLSCSCRQYKLMSDALMKQLEPSAMETSSQFFDILSG